MTKYHKDNVPCPKCSDSVTRPQNLRWHLIFTHDFRPTEADAIMNDGGELIEDTIIDSNVSLNDNKDMIEVEL